MPLKNIAEPPELFRIAVAPVAEPRRRAPWRMALALGLLGAAALGVWWLRPRGPELPVASRDAGAQADFEASVRATSAGDFDGALELLDAARKLDLESPMLEMAFAAVPNRFDTSSLAHDAARRVAGRDDADARSIRLFGWTAADGTDDAHAAAWDAWVAENPRSEWGAWLRARSYPPPRRDELMSEYAASHPDDVAAAFEVAERAVAHDPGAAIDDVRARLARREIPVLDEALGELLEASGDIAGARAAYRKAIEGDRSLAESRVRLANLALAEGDEAERRSVSDAAVVVGDRLPPAGAVLAGPRAGALRCRAKA